MTAAEAEKAFREMLPCETKTLDTSLMRILKYDKPYELIIQRDDSLLTKTFLVFKSGENCLIRYPIEKLKLSEN